jgi:nickel/cobalt transporter (NicO) family protein
VAEASWRAGLLAVLAGMALAVLAAPAFGQVSPFGVGLAEPGGGGLLPWVAELQRQFYREMTTALGALRDSGQAAWWLAGLSFAYGVVHAAGPGHGKVVITSYLLANEQAARRGVAIAFLAAMVQASVAVALVGGLATALNMTSFAITDTARILEIGSYGLIAALGLYLLVRKGRAIWREYAGRSPVAAHACGAAAAHAPDSGCGHAHFVPPSKAASRGGAAAAILSVGIRPCTGALIVLVFALTQGIFWAGVASTFLMGLGTALTIAVLAAIAVGGKDLAARLARGDSRRAGRIMLALELCGALAITGFGLLLLGGALSA